MGTVQIDGSTPKITVGTATAEDATILFDGTAQDFYIALDDSADDLLIGLGSTVGTTPAIAIDENLKVNIPVTTASTSASTGSLTTGGGAGIGADLYVGDDAYLITDSAVLGFGADKDTTLTHTDGTCLTLNSTNKLCFNDASQFVQGSSATVLSIGATDEIDLTATAIDINGTCDISGTFSLGGTNITTTAAEINLIDGGTSRGTTAIADADGVLINDDGTMRMTTAATLKTYIGGGITEADSWRLDGTVNMATTGAFTDITANWEQVDTDGFGVLGTGLSESSGIFTFPSTGYWRIFYSFYINSDSGADNYMALRLFTTLDNSSYDGASDASGHFPGDQDNIQLSNDFIFDVTNTTNCKIKFAYTTGATNNIIGDGGLSQSNFSVIKLADT